MPRKLFPGVILCPSTASLKIADLGKPPTRQAMPFLSDLIEANCTLHGSHLLPPGTRQFGGRSTTAENHTETTAYSWSTHVLRFLALPNTAQNLEANVQLIGNLAYDAATEKQHARNENRTLNDEHPFPDWSKLKLHDQDCEGPNDWAKYGAKTAHQSHQYDFT
jgi:hypothetical protein